MRILFVTNGLQAGGSERVVALLANRLAERKHDVSVICVRGKESFYPIHQEVHLFFLDKEQHCDSLWKKMLWIRSYVRRMGIEVVIAFIVRVYGFTIAALLGCGVPVITSERNDPRSFNLLSRWIMRVFLPLSSRHVVQTTHIKAYYPSFIQRKTIIIPNPVSSKVLSQPVVQKRDLLISVGRLVPQKNQQLLIDSFAAIADKHPTYQLVIYGEGLLRDSLQQRIRQLGMEERILLPGRTKDIIRRLAEARIFCLSSTHEGMSNAMIEAVCVGLPVVTTRVSGVEELVTDGENGLVVQEDISAYSAALDRLMNDNTLQEQMGRNGRQRAELFDLTNIIRLWETIMMKTRKRDRHCRY